MDDYLPPKPTPRHQAAIDLQGWLVDSGISHSRKFYERSKNGRCYVLFFEGPWICGTVEIYSTSYCIVSWFGDVRGEPVHDRRILASVEQVIAFLCQAVREDDLEGACRNVPERQSKRHLKRHQSSGDINHYGQGT